MKKFYTFALAAVLTLSASAQSLGKMAAAATLNITETAVMRAEKATKHADVSLRKQAPAKTAKAAAFATLDDMEGEYTWSSKTLLEDESGNPYPAPSMVAISVHDAAKNEVAITFLSGANPVIATVDLSEGTFTIANKQFLATVTTGDVYFYLKSVSDDGKILAGASDDESVIGTISENIITFPALSVWAVGFPENESQGWLILTYANSFEGEEPEPENPNEGWTSVGEATLYDPWLMPAFGFDQHEEPWQVELQQKDADKNVYRLVDPYRGKSPLAEFNESTAAHGYIQFNVSDPDHVYFEAVKAGYADSELEISKLYCYNTLTFYSLYADMEPAAVVDILGDKIPYTTFKDGVVSLGSATVEGKVMYDACFGDQSNIAGGYRWVDKQDNSVDMSGKIVFPTNFESGLTNVQVAGDAKIEYFNLQGIRVANPNGGVFIKRQGDKATKVFVK